MYGANTVLTRNPIKDSRRFDGNNKKEEIQQDDSSADVIEGEVVKEEEKVEK